MAKKKKEMILLSPDWSSLGVLKYKVHRTDHFSYDGRKRYPIDNQYEIHLRLIKNRKKDDLIEVFYPKGIIYFLTCFQPFSSFRGKEDLFSDPNRDAFQYLTYKNGYLKRLGNSEKLKIYPSIIKTLVKEQNFSDETEKNLIDDIDYLEAKKQRSNYLSRDLEIIHEYAGYEIPKKMKLSSKSKKHTLTKKELAGLNKKEKKLLAQFNFEIGEMTMMKIKGDEKELVINSVDGINLFSVDEKDAPDFKKIKNDFKSEDFSIENYKNITLHHRIYKFDKRDKVLKYYLHGRITNNPKMNKITKVEIERID